MSVEIRATRPALYAEPTCSGYTDPSTRQGHYFNGETTHEAIRRACRHFPAEPLDVEIGFVFMGRFVLRFPGEPEEHAVQLPPTPSMTPASV